MRNIKIARRITHRDSSLEKYLSDIGKIPLLKPQEEVELSNRIKNGDDTALKKLIRANLRFVVSVAKQYYHPNLGLSLGDLINEGNIGLTKAAPKFDETLGFKFISFVVWPIRKSIAQALTEKSRMVRLPSNRIASHKRVSNEISKWTQAYEMEPSHEQIANILEMKTEEVESLLQDTNTHLSLNSSIGLEEDSTLLDVIENSDSMPPDETLINESLKKECEEILSILPNRDAQIVSCYLGLGEQELSIEEIGKKFRLSPESIGRIINVSIQSLKDHFAQKNRAA